MIGIRTPHASTPQCKKFNHLLEEYYHTEQQMKRGVPSVAYFAGELAYSARYFGDMVHKATGGTAIGYIHSVVVDQGKNLLMRRAIDDRSRISALG